MISVQCVITLFFIFHYLTIKVQVGHPAEIDEIFDAISYSKGASVIRMLHNYIGDKVCLEYSVYLGSH